MKNGVFVLNEFKNVALLIYNYFFCMLILHLQIKQRLKRPE